MSFRNAGNPLCWTDQQRGFPVFTKQTEGNRLIICLLICSCIVYLTFSCHNITFEIFVISRNLVYHASIRKNFLEETCEALEAIDADDPQLMQEELGDVLMQVVFHARMAQEAGRFDLQDVIDEVVDKLIRRHPHVFGDTHVDNSDEVLVNWEAIKKQEKQERKHVLDGVSQGLPALLRAYKLQSKAAKVGFDWPDSASVWAKVQEELGELQEALQAGDKAAAESELGDVLFAVVNYARHYGIEPEVALDGTNNRFAARFNYVEKQVEDSGKGWQDFTLAELDKFWDEAKELEHKQIL